MKLETKKQRKARERKLKRALKINRLLLHQPKKYFLEQYLPKIYYEYMPCTAGTYVPTASNPCQPVNQQNQAP